jgi:hypothetical protein
MNGNEKKLNPGDRVRISEGVGPEEVDGQEGTIVDRLWELSDGTRGYNVAVVYLGYNREFFFFGEELTLISD